MKLEGHWEVAVIDLKLESQTRTTMYLLNDICTSDFVYGSLLSVLRWLDTKSACFNYLNFIKVNKPQIQSIKIFIKSNLMQEVEVQNLFCTLCLKQTRNIIL